MAKEEPTTVTIDRAVFLDVAGSAFAAYMIAQTNYLTLIKRGLLSFEEATAGLEGLRVRLETRSMADPSEK